MCFFVVKRVVCEKDGRKRALVGKGMRKRGGEKSKKTVSEKNREIGKEGFGEEHRETRNSIWKKKKGVVVLEKQKKIKNGKNKSRGRRKGTKKNRRRRRKGRKPFGKSIRKGEKGKNERVKCQRGRGKSRAEFDGGTAREKQTRSRGTNTRRFQSSVQKIRQILSAASLKTQDNHGKAEDRKKRKFINSIGKNFCRFCLRIWTVGYI